MSALGEIAAGLVPTAGVVFLFWLAIRALVQGDRRERAAQARLDAERDVELDAELDAERDQTRGDSPQ